MEHFIYSTAAAQTVKKGTVSFILGFGARAEKHHFEIIPFDLIIISLHFLCLCLHRALALLTGFAYWLAAAEAA